MKSAREIIKEIIKEEENFVCPMGIEHEFFVYNKNIDQPVKLWNFQSFFKDIEKLPSIRSCGPEVGANMLEIAYEPARNIIEYKRMVFEVFDFLSNHHVSRDWKFLFSDNPYFCGLTPDPLYFALHKKCGFEAAAQLSMYASFQVSFGVEELGGIFSDKSKKLLYILNNLAPLLSVFFEGEKNRKSHRLPFVFNDFTVEQKRLPHPFSIDFVLNIENELKKFPYLILKDFYTDSWIDARGKLPERIDSSHCKTIFWDVRLNGVGDVKEERVEFRPLNTTSPQDSLDIVIKLNKLIEYILETEIDQIPQISEDLWWKLRKKEEDALTRVDEIIRKIPSLNKK